MVSFGHYEWNVMPFGLYFGILKEHSSNQMTLCSIHNAQIES